MNRRSLSRGARPARALPLLLVALTALTACQRVMLEEAGRQAEVPAPAPTPGPASASSVAPLTASAPPRVGVKNFHQIFRSMALVTGVPPVVGDNDLLTQTYTAVRSQLPQDNEIASLQAAHHMAILKLGSAFCERLFASVELRDALFPPAQFPGLAYDSPTPLSVYTPARNAGLAARLLERFWGAATPGSADRTADVATTAELLGSLAADAPPNAAGTMGVIKGACTAALGGFPFLQL